MAPEVFRHEVYNEKVDVYSFSLIVYWMLTGCRPFGDIISAIEAARLASLGKRSPNAMAISNLSMRSLMQRAWSLDADERPDFDEILAEVKTQASKSGSSCSIQ